MSHEIARGKTWVWLTGMGWDQKRYQRTRSQAIKAKENGREYVDESLISGHEKELVYLGKVKYRAQQERGGVPKGKLVRTRGICVRRVVSVRE